MLFLFLSIINFLVTPPKLTVVTFGGITTEKITVKNIDREKPLRIKAYTGDWLLNEDGKIYYLEPGRVSFSCSPWISINPREFTIPPGGNKEVRVTLDIPKIQGGYWGVVFFEAVPIPSEWTPTIRVSGRIGLTVYVSSGDGLLKRGELTSLIIANKEVKICFKNEGNIWLRPSVKLYIKKGEKEVYKDSIINNVVLPNFERIFTFDLKNKLKKGLYTFTADIDYGGNEILRGEREVNIEK